MYPALVHELAKLLEETEERPLMQIAAVIDVLGEQAVLELLAETQRVDDAGGMLAAGGSRRRTRGGVFFALTRRRLGKKDRLAIFGWRKPEPEHGDDVHLGQDAATKEEYSGDSSGGGGGRAADEDEEGGHGEGGPTDTSNAGEANLPRVEAEPRPDTIAVLVPTVEAATPSHEPTGANLTSPDLIPLPNPTIPTNTVDLMTDMTDPKNPMDEPPAATPSVPHVARDEMARAMARTTARRAVARAIAGLEPIDQRLVLLDTLAELEQGQVGQLDDRGLDVHVRAAPASPPPSTSVDQPERPAEGAEVTPSDVEAPAPEGFNGHGRNGTRRAAILGAIRDTPGVGLGELALRIYGVDEPVNRKRVQSLVSVLKRSGEVHSAGRGRFEAV